MKILLLGCGMIGRTIALDLANESGIYLTSADVNSDALNKLKPESINKLHLDSANENQLEDLLKNFDLVINATPGSTGYQTLKKIIESGKDVVDIAFYKDDPFSLNYLAEQNNITALVDCGVSPGISNLLIGRASEEFDKINNLEIFVGGLPKKKDGLFDYKAVFSISDLIEEYLRPARSIKNGKIISAPALSEIKEITFAGLEILEAFNSDGLRTLLKTIDSENMSEYTIRYKGHTEKMKLLRDALFFSKDTIEVNGREISPFDFTSKLLSKIIKFTDKDRDITLLKIIMQGEKDKISKKIIFEMFDEFDENTGTHSMARTTGYMASMCVRLIANKIFDAKGIFPPELIGKNEKAFNYVMDGLEKRNIKINKRSE